ncbi:hypothetical protein I3W98_32365, partial [Streptomyces cavourensis]|nr:hypothetical protein [Streptomyces cavourensis]
MSTAHPAAASAPARVAVVTGVGLAVPGLTLPDELLGTVRDGGFDPATGLVGRDLRHKVTMLRVYCTWPGVSARMN